jgi:predicted nuclease of predicted toxin-antitoxin system
MRLLIDMNLSPAWTPLLERHGIESLRWHLVGAANELDASIMSFARERDWVVFTHDLDFGTLLALTQAAKPSVVQVRCPDPDPALIGELVLRNLRAYEHELKSGALLVIDEKKHRVRLLPLQPKLRS